MKETSIKRPVDALGRIVLPKELRNSLGIVDNQDSLEIYTEGDKIILKKAENSCTFCSSTDNLVEYMDKCICENCAKKIAELAK